MINYAIFECEIEPTIVKDQPEIHVKKDNLVTNACPVAKDRRLQTIRKHLEQVYQVDRVLLWKMSHCTAHTQMTDIINGLKIVRLLEKAIQRRLFDEIRQNSDLAPAIADAQ